MTILSQVDHKLQGQDFLELKHSQKKGTDNQNQMSSQNSVTGNLERDCGQHFGRKFLIGAIIFLVGWTSTKIPYYMAFDANGDTPYEKGGLTGSINLEHWIPGFRSTKLRSPACNFLLVHICFGATTLIMSALALTKATWRRKYGYYFFTFAILLGVHTIPAAWTTPQLPLRIIFLFTCIYVIITAMLGFNTLRLYDNNPTKCEKHLQYEYAIITFGAYGAGFAEFSGIYGKVKFYLAEGYWQNFGDVPDPLFGHTLYDLLPERVGMTIFLAFVTIFWLWWPVKIVGIDTNVPGVTNNVKQS